ncbi:hypothetical protein AABB24_021331, partial [Solanum stoloniferum]
TTSNVHNGNNTIPNDPTLLLVLFSSEQQRRSSTPTTPTSSSLSASRNNSSSTRPHCPYVPLLSVESTRKSRPTTLQPNPSPSRPFPHFKGFSKGRRDLDFGNWKFHPFSPKSTQNSLYINIRLLSDWGAEGEIFEFSCKVSRLCLRNFKPIF